MRSRKNRTCYWMLVIFLVAGWIVSSVKVLPEVLPAALVATVNIGCVLLCPVALFLAVRSIFRGDFRLTPMMKGYIQIFFICVFCLTLYGIVSGNVFRILVFDLLALAPVAAGILLGSRDEVWDYITPVALTLTGIAIVLSIIYTDSRILEDRSIINQETGTAFESVLTLIPVLAAAKAGEKRTRWSFPLMFACMGILFVYLYFGRRGVSLRASLEVMAVAFVAPAVGRMRSRAIINGVLVAFFGVGLLLYFPFELLLDRYQGNNGVVATVTTDNERWFEGSILWDDLSPVEVIVGRGIGGVFAVDVDNGYFLDVLDGERVGKFGTHMGALWPLLKGGLIFAFLYFVPSLYLMTGIFSLQRMDPITRGTVIVAPIWFAFQFIDGSISYSTPWMAFGTGMLLSRFDRVGPSNGWRLRSTGQPARAQPMPELFPVVEPVG
jgi:hypothetical protein